jgi:hypothetical protein
VLLFTNVKNDGEQPELGVGFFLNLGVRHVNQVVGVTDEGWHPNDVCVTRGGEKGPHALGKRAV